VAENGLDAAPYGADFNVAGTIFERQLLVAVSLALRAVFDVIFIHPVADFFEE